MELEIQEAFGSWIACLVQSVCKIQLQTYSPIVRSTFPSVSQYWRECLSQFPMCNVCKVLHTGLALASDVKKGGSYNPYLHLGFGAYLVHKRLSAT